MPQLLEENSLQELLLSRMSALLAWVPWHRERMNEQLDALSEICEGTSSMTTGSGGQLSGALSSGWIGTLLPRPAGPAC